MMLFLYGTIANSIPVPEAGSQGVIDNPMLSIDSYIPSLTAMIIGTTGLMSITITMATYRENGILRRLRATPVSPLVVLAAQVTVVLVMIGLGMLLLVTAGTLVYHIRFAGNVFSMLGGFILSSLSFFGIGFILAGTMPTARSAQTIAMVLLYPI
jgi:ABC-2 type transport system permease protein